MLLVVILYVLFEFLPRQSDGPTPFLGKLVFDKLRSLVQSSLFLVLFSGFPFNAMTKCTVLALPAEC